MLLKNQFGDLYDHPQKKNYDDLNEFFWDKYHLFEVKMIGNNTPRYEWGSFERLKNAMSKKDVTKTFVERRGIFHSFKTKIRVFTFYAVLYQVIVSIAFDVPYSQDWLPLCPLRVNNHTTEDKTWDQSSAIECVVETA